MIKLFNLKINKLMFNLKKNSGRNNTGKIVIKNRGGGNKYKLRFIDYKRYLYIPAIILKQENIKKNSATIALILYKNGLLSYIISAHNLKIGTIINNNINFIGSNLLLKHAFVGSIIYNVETIPGNGAQFARAAGSFCQIINLFKYKNKLLILIRLKSKKEYILDKECNCVFGIASYLFFKYYKPYTKAGQRRIKGSRPHVRGVAMNPIDHPHGGNTSGGRCSISIYGVLAKGYKTKKKKLPYNYKNLN
jgi:large subunit ribosomal protein L2